MASAVLTGGLFGMLGKFSAAYISAASSGQSLGGIFAAVAEILSLWLGASPQLSAFVYFMVANVFLVVSIVCYLVLIRAVSQCTLIFLCFCHLDLPFLHVLIF